MGTYNVVYYNILFQFSVELEQILVLILNHIQSNVGRICASLL